MKNNHSEYQRIFESTTYAQSTARSKDPTLWSTLSQEDKLLAIHSSFLSEGPLNVGHIALKAGAFQTFKAILHDPIWNACALMNPEQKIKIDLALAKVYACHPELMEIISQKDPAIAWYGTMYLTDESVEPRHYSKPEINIKFFNSEPIRYHTDNQGGPTPFLFQALRDDHWRYFSKALSIATRATNPHTFDNRLVLKVAELCLARAITLDAGLNGHGDPYAPEAGIASFRQLCERKCAPNDLLELLELWGSLGRGHSVFAKEISNQHPSFTAGILTKNLINPSTTSSLFKQLHLPARLDPAWVSAFQTFDAHGIECTKLHQFAAKGDIPFLHLTPPPPKMKHPLLSFFTLWQNAKKTSKPLPQHAIDNAMTRFLSEISKLPPDWNSVITPWSDIAKQVKKQLLAGPSDGEFPGGPLCELSEITLQKNKPLSPIAFRLLFPSGTALSYKNGLGSSAAIMHCALASASLGFNISTDLLNLRQLSSQEVSGIESAIIHLECKTSSIKKITSRI